MDQPSEGTLTIIDTTAIALDSKEVIDSQIATAKQYPRNISRSTENAVALATLDKESAESCSYALPRGGKTIVGPTIHMARMIASTWGNLRVASRVVGVSATEVESESICHDLETNVAVKVSVKRKITDSKGRRFKDDMITVTGNAANSISARNAILAVIPKNVVDKVYKAAQEKITGDLSDENALIARRKQAIDHFQKTHGVGLEAILDRLGKNAIEQIRAKEISVLLGLDRAIKDGDTTVEDSFPATRKDKAESKANKSLETIKNATAKK